MICGIIGIVFSFIPGVNWIGFFLGILASDKARSFKFTIKALDEDGVSLGEDTLDVKSLAPSESKSVLIFKSSNLSNGTLEDANYVVSKSSTY